MRVRVRLAVTVACGLLATLLSANAVRAARAESEQERAEMLERYGGEVTTLVVARRELSAGDVVAEADVEEREWLADLAPEGAETSLDDVVGKRLTSAVAARAPVASCAFSDVDGALQVPDGKVAVSVRVSDKTGVTTGLAAGTRLIAFEDEASAGDVLAAEVVVLGGTTTQGARSQAGQTLTLATSPDELARILSASAEGTLRLAVPAEGVKTIPQAPAAPTSVPSEGGEE